MTSTATALEEALCAAYLRQAACYRQALQRVQALHAALQEDRDPQAVLQTLAAPLEEVSAIEAHIQEAKVLWKQSGLKPGAPLQAVVNEVAGLIQNLLECIADADHQARVQSSRLAPELESLVKSQQMRRAYGGTMTRQADPQ